MNIQLFLLILKARYKVVLFTLLTTVVITAVVSLIWPKSYTASVALVVDMKGYDPVTSMVMAGGIMPGYMTTQIDIVNSDRVAQKAVKLMKIDQNPRAREQWQDATDGRGTIESWLGTTLKASLDVKPAKDSNVININYTGSDPKFSAFVANAFAQAYIDTNLELKVEPARQYASWFDGRTKVLRDGYEKSQAKLSAYQQERGIVATDERVDTETARLADLSSQLTQFQAQAVDSSSRQRQGGLNADTLPEVLQSGVVQTLKSDIARQEAKLQETGGQLGKNHPQYQRMATEIQSLREKLSAETKQVASSLGTNNRVNQQRVAEIKSALAEQKVKVLELKQQRDEISLMQRDVESAQRSFDAVTQRFTQSSLESQANQTNIAVLSPAVEPLRPSKPRVFLNILLATFVGTLVGIGMAFMLELIDRCVRSSEELVEVLRLPVLGILEATRSPNKLQIFLETVRRRVQRFATR